MAWALDGPEQAEVAERLLEPWTTWTGGPSGGAPPAASGTGGPELSAPPPETPPAPTPPLDPLDSPFVEEEEPS